MRKVNVGIMTTGWNSDLLVYVTKFRGVDTFSNQKKLTDISFSHEFKNHRQIQTFSKKLRKFKSFVQVTISS